MEVTTNSIGIIVVEVPSLWYIDRNFYDNLVFPRPYHVHANLCEKTLPLFKFNFKQGVKDILPATCVEMILIVAYFPKSNQKSRFTLNS